LSCNGASTPPQPISTAPVPVDALAGNVVATSATASLWGAYADPLTLRYSSLRDASFKGTATNLCRFGDQVADMLWQQVYLTSDPGSTGSPLYTVMISTNDADFCAPSSKPGCLTNYTATLGASVAWLTLTHTDKIFDQSPAVTKVGSWESYDAPMAGVSTQVSGVGDTLQFPVTQNIAGRHLYLDWHVRINDGGSADLFIDGVQVDTLYTSGNTGANTLTNKFNTDQVFLRPPSIHSRSNPSALTRASVSLTCPRRRRTMEYEVRATPP